MKTYGAWKITEREYLLAQTIANKGEEGAADAYQLVRYCRGQIFYRDAAAEAARIIRAQIKEAVS